MTPTTPSEPLKPSTGAAVRDHRNAVRDRSKSLSAIDRNHCPHSPESAPFALIPTLASLERPIIAARYWLIGAPSLIVFVVFLMRAFFRLGADPTLARLISWGGVLASLVFLVLTDSSGYFSARALTEVKPIWRGLEVVAPLLRNCPKASVHFNGFVPEFAAALHVPEAVFADATAPGTELVCVGNSSCPVLGWAEHLNRHVED